MSNTSTSMTPSPQESVFLDSFLEQKIKFIDHEDFDKPDFAHKRYPLKKQPVWTWASAMLGEFSQEDMEASELVLLTKDEERAMLLHMNWHRKMLYSIQQRCIAEKREPDKNERRRILRHYRNAMYTREQITLFNLGMVFAVSKKLYSKGHVQNLDAQERWSECLAAMLRTIDCFNVVFGYKFSTYFFNAAFRSMQRLSMKESKIAKRYKVASSFSREDEDLEFMTQIAEGDDTGRGFSRGPREDLLGHIEPDAIDIVYKMLNETPTGTTRNCPTLTPEERLSFLLRHANEEQYTLEQIADMVSQELKRDRPTKERIRQMIQSAMRKIQTRVEHRVPGTFPKRVKDEEYMMVG